ncbi:MAG: S1 RNA-binding domain-containing protein [Rhodopseudomonas palustris]|nr:S1 RNA-binding domain-containing protein [Rhodopseudomonas palustris]
MPDFDDAHRTEISSSRSSSSTSAAATSWSRRRVILEEEREREAQETARRSSPSARCAKGIVKNITDFGAFVDLGGVDGLLHITDLSWGRVSHPSEVVADRRRSSRSRSSTSTGSAERISLGMKQLQPLPVGGRRRASTRSARSVQRQGRLDHRLRRLRRAREGRRGPDPHLRDVAGRSTCKHPSKVVSDRRRPIEAVVLNVDKENEKISLGIKQLEPDPWKTLDGKYPVGTALKGKVRNLTNFGAFVEIEDGIDGLIHISDLSWTKKVKHPGEVLKEGEEIDVVVLDVNKAERRLSLGYKQLTEDPWTAFEETYKVGHHHSRQGDQVHGKGPRGRC